MIAGYKWAHYHAFRSNGLRSKGWLRYMMDRFDIHPKRDFFLMRARFFSMLKDQSIPVFVHIPKTGGTYLTSRFPRFGFVSLNHMLLREQCDDTYVPIGLMGTRYRPQKNEILFTTVRNPFTFLRSYYHHVVGHGDYHNPLHYDYSAAQKGFAYLVKTIIDRDDVWPSRKFLFPQLFHQNGHLVVHWINKNETLDDDMSLFASQLGYIFEPGPKQRASPVKPLKDYFDESLCDSVHVAYSRELKLFGYDGNTPALHRDVTGKDVWYDYRRDLLRVDGNVW